jgi:hypothetical protein
LIVVDERNMLLETSLADRYRGAPTVDMFISAEELCVYISSYVYVNAKAIPVTGREGPEGCETSRLPHFLDNRLTDGFIYIN